MLLKTNKKRIGELKLVVPRLKKSIWLFKRNFVLYDYNVTNMIQPELPKNTF